MLWTKIKFGFKGSKSVRFLVLPVLLSVLFSLFVYLPASALSTSYGVGDYYLVNQSSGTPTTAYRIANNSYSSFNETGVSYGAGFWSSTDSSVIIRHQMRGSNNTMPAMVANSIVEYTVVTNNLTWRSNAFVDSQFAPLGCELSGTVGSYSSWSCLGINTDVQSGGSSHYFLAGNAWSITNTSYSAFIQVVNWNQYAPESDTQIDYTSLLSDIRSNTEATATLNQQIRNQLISLNTTATNIYSILQTMNDRLQSVNQSATNQAQQDAEDRENAQQSVDDSQTDASQAGQEVSNASASVTNSMSNIISSIINSPATDCIISITTGSNGALQLNNMNLCSAPPEILNLIHTISGIVITVAVLWCAYSLFNAVMSILEWFQGERYKG